MDDKTSKNKRASALVKLQRQYVEALHSNPVLTKALTSGIVSMLGNLTAQYIEKQRGSLKEITLPPILRYGAFGFVITGPVMHLFYKWLDRTIPPKGNEAMVKRLLLERLLFSPIFMVIFHVAMAGMEFQSKDAIKARLKAAYWATLVMNWKFWTILQIINVNYIPRDMKILFGSTCGLLWNIYLAASKPKME